MKLRITDIDVPNVEVTNNRNILYATRNHFPLLSRISMSAIFIWSGIGKIMNPVSTQEYMSAYGIKFTSVLLIAAIAVEISGGLSLLLGIKPRYGAIALACLGARSQSEETSEGSHRCFYFPLPLFFIPIFPTKSSKSCL